MATTFPIETTVAEGQILSTLAAAATVQTGSTAAPVTMGGSTAADGTAATGSGTASVSMGGATAADGTAASGATAGTNVAEERSGTIHYVMPIAEELVTIKADALCVDGAIVVAGQPGTRGLALRITIAANPITAGNITLVGVGPSGEAISEVKSLITNVSVTLYTNHAFAKVTSGTVAGLVGGGGAGDNLSIGVSTKLGLVGCKVPAPTAWAVHKTTVAASTILGPVDEAVAGVDATYGTVSPTTAPNGAKCFDFYYTYTVTPTQNTHTHSGPSHTHAATGLTATDSGHTHTGPSHTHASTGLTATDAGHTHTQN